MKKRIIALSLISMLVLASCGTKNNSSEQSRTEAATTAAETTAETTVNAAESTTETVTEHETAAQNEVGFEGMTEVGADALNMGNYYVSVDSSSSMFKIADCILHVSDDGMNADIIIDSKSYDALFMGTEEDAKNAAALTLSNTPKTKADSRYSMCPLKLSTRRYSALLSAQRNRNGTAALWYSAQIPCLILLSGSRDMQLLNHSALGTENTALM